MRTSLLVCAVAAVAALTGCVAQRGRQQTVSGGAGPVTATTSATPSIRPMPTGPVEPSGTAAHTDQATPASASAVGPRPAAVCPVSAPVLLTAAYRAGSNLAHVESEPIDCWNGYAATVLVTGSGNTHPGDTGLYLFRLDHGRWRLVTSGAVAECTPYLPPAYLSHFPHCS
jgi:hypothetical protein